MRWQGIKWRLPPERWGRSARLYRQGCTEQLIVVTPGCRKQVEVASPDLAFADGIATPGMFSRLPYRWFLAAIRGIKPERAGFAVPRSFA